MTTTRRSFLKKQLILGSSMLLASNLHSLAMMNKSLNAAGGLNPLNLLCTSDLARLDEYRRTIKNFDLSSINLFAGNVSNATENNLYQLGRINYHGVNFSLDKKIVNLEALASEINYNNINFVNCNYDFENEVMRRNVSPYIIIYSGKTKIGITGIGAYTNTNGIKVKEPIAALNKIAKHLKNNEGCDKVICLADLGFDKKNRQNNLMLAQASLNVNVIVGAGVNPQQVTAWSYRNVDKQEVLVSANESVERPTNLMQLSLNHNTTLFNTKNI